MADPSNEIPGRRGLEPSAVDRRAECEGGGPLPGTRWAARMEFTGRLTGEYVDHGDPPWRWYLMVDLEKKPDQWEWKSAWCESSSLYYDDDSGPPGALPGSAPGRAPSPGSKTASGEGKD